MWGMSFLLTAINYVLGNKLITQIIASLIQLAKDNDDAIMETAVNIITKTWSSEGTGTDKMNSLVSQLMEQFPNVQKSVLQTLSQTAFNYVQTLSK
jgi:hypothetical protein